MTETFSAVLPSQAIIVGDHPLFRAGLVSALEREPDLEVVADASVADIAVVDLTPSGSPLDTVIETVRRSCGKVLALSVFCEPVVIASALRAGANGYALKSQSPAEITSAIRATLAGARYLPPSVSVEAVATLLGEDIERPLASLTRREREVFELLIRGFSNDEVAARLFVARRTIETHRQRILKKLSAHSILEMTRIAAWHSAMFG